METYLLLRMTIFCSLHTYNMYLIFIKFSDLTEKWTNFMWDLYDNNTEICDYIIV